MKMNSVYSAFRTKGPIAFSHRMGNISRHYGFSTEIMERSLRRFTDLLQCYDCAATFPITAVTLKRHSDIIQEYQTKKVEFAIHGYTHEDYSLLNQHELEAQIKKSINIFNDAGLSPQGFRSPYLRQNKYLYSVIGNTSLSYVSNQPFFWETPDICELTITDLTGYKKGFTYYEPWLSTLRPSIPRFVDNLVEIPVSLPDDEILVDRCQLDSSSIIKVWLSMLMQAYQRGELFTLQLHPERIPLCAECLEVLLIEARALKPAIWCATLGEIANWWKELNQAEVEITSRQGNQYQVSTKTSKSVTILTRGVEVVSPSSPAWNNNHEVKTSDFTLVSNQRPIIGISHRSSPDLKIFLKQQGYITEISQEKELYSFYFDMEYFDSSQEKSVLELIEKSNRPLVRLCRWPDGAQSALAITGDIDAMTLWDYGLRLVGK